MPTRRSSSSRRSLAASAVVSRRLANPLSFSPSTWSSPIPERATTRTVTRCRPGARRGPRYLHAGAGDGKTGPVGTERRGLGQRLPCRAKRPGDANTGEEMYESDAILAYHAVVEASGVDKRGPYKPDTYRY